MKTPMKQFRGNTFEDLYWHTLEIASNGKAAFFQTPETTFRKLNGVYGDPLVQLAHTFYQEGLGKEVIPKDYNYTKWKS